MRKNNLFFLLFATLCFAGKTMAQETTHQPCFTDELHKKQIALHPELVQIEADYEKQITEALKHIDLNKAARTTFTDQSGNESFWYDIPVVVHVIHDFGGEYVSDNTIFNAVRDWNTVYAKQNSDTSEVILPFKGNIPNSHTRYIGNPRIRIHLATMDPNGNPSTGITRHRSYLTYSAGEMAKYDDWANNSYVNIWVINQMSAANGQAAAYAHLPPDVSFIPFWDGIITLSSYLGTDKTINHEMGHMFNLYHPWGSTNNPAVACGDDNVDDTPPTMGHNTPGCQYSLPSSNQNSTYDTACATNYFKIYTDATGHDSLVNYPDTTNAQNIMDYTYCSRMFTYGQVQRMHAALNSSVGGRNNLWDTANLIATGVLDASTLLYIPKPDLKPIPDFSATRTASAYKDKVNYFTFPGINVTFKNQSWRDTVTALAWTFSNGASAPTSTSLGSVITYFTQPGWVDITMKATGNHTGDTTVEWKNAIFVADSVGVNASTYVQNWQPGDDIAKWPSFNYYNNEFRWKWDSTVGYDDHYCMKYTGFDTRLNLSTFNIPHTGSPYGDFDDLFSVPVDLSSYTDTCNIDFYTAAASRSASSLDVNDSLEIDYTVNSGVTWTKLTVLAKSNLVNRGAMAEEFFPTSSLDWAAKTVGIPAAARKALTVFRFRYLPGVANLVDPYFGQPYSSGNDFYMDRIHFSRIPADVDMVKLANAEVVIVPNPTGGDAYVVVKDADNETAKVIVTDLTGKVVYSTSEQMTGSEVRILVPHATISVAGMYLVTVTTGSQSQTKKLVVY